MAKKADLIAQAEKQGIKVTGKETVAQLEELLKPSTNPEETVPHVVSEEDMENNPELANVGIHAGDEVGLPKVEEAAPVFETEASHSDKTEFEVYNGSGGYVRTYSLELHGQDAEKLANQYAGKIGGSVR